MNNQPSVLETFNTVRAHTEAICVNLKTEDYQVQPVEETSPPKWHLAHTSWFFEVFILEKYKGGYKSFNQDYNFFFNSYYETLGVHTLRTQRGNLTRPTVKEVYAYRAHVDRQITALLSEEVPEGVLKLMEVGLNHEQQHQELLITDLKYILALNPTFPSVLDIGENTPTDAQVGWASIEGGLHKVGFSGGGFCFDNETPRHTVHLTPFSIRLQPVSNKEYLAFMAAGGYHEVTLWHAEGWQWVKENHIQAPLYWEKIEGEWFAYTLNGLEKIMDDAPVTHISFYEAFAFASWAGFRLPTEFEWEVASDTFAWGERWEWTHSAYLPYPGYQKEEGALGEYNGKFMVNQMVLRGASVATSKGHSRPTYRNFFHPHLRWQFTGLRLAR